MQLVLQTELRLIHFKRWLQIQQNRHFIWKTLGNLINCPSTLEEVSEQNVLIIFKLVSFSSNIDVTKATEFWQSYLPFLCLCDFAKRYPLSVAGKKSGGLLSSRCHQRAQAQTYPWVGDWLVLCENQGGREGRSFVTLIRVLCQKVVQSQRIFPVG